MVLNQLYAWEVLWWQEEGWGKMNLNSEELFLSISLSLHLSLVAKRKVPDKINTTKLSGQSGFVSIFYFSNREKID